MQGSTRCTGSLFCSRLQPQSSMWLAEEGRACSVGSRPLYCCRVACSERLLTACCMAISCSSGAKMRPAYPDMLFPMPRRAWPRLSLSSSPAMEGRMIAAETAVASPAMMPHRMRLTTTYIMVRMSSGTSAQSAITSDLCRNGSSASCTAAMRGQGFHGMCQYAYSTSSRL